MYQRLSPGVETTLQFYIYLKDFYSKGLILFKLNFSSNDICETYIIHIHSSALNTLNGFKLYWKL